MHEVTGYLKLNYCSK